MSIGTFPVSLCGAREARIVRWSPLRLRRWRICSNFLFPLISHGHGGQRHFIKLVPTFFSETLHQTTDDGEVDGRSEGEEKNGKKTDNIKDSTTNVTTHITRFSSFQNYVANEDHLQSHSDGRAAARMLSD